MPANLQPPAEAIPCVETPARLNSAAKARPTLRVAAEAVSDAGAGE